jgi:hypothetical protein
MPVTITPVYQYIETALPGQYLRFAKLQDTGLPANANTPVAHGLTDAYGNPVTPIQVGLEPKSNSVFWEYQNADGTNIYVGVGAASGNHAVDIYLTY